MPVGECKVTWTAAVGETESVTWSKTIQSVHRTHQEPAPTNPRGHGANCEYPEFGGRCSRGTASIAWDASRGRRRKIERTGDRWEAYDSSLDPNSG